MFCLAPGIGFGLIIALVAVYFSSVFTRNRFDGCCPVRNWEHRHSFGSPTVLRPTSLPEVIAAVNLARQEKKRLTVVGSGHSYADIAVPDNGIRDGSGASSNGSVLVCMRCYSGLVEVKSDQNLVTVLAGTTLEQLIAVLDEHSLAMDVIPTVFEPTIGGIISAGSHGCGTKHSSVSSLVREIELVTPNGEVVTASPTENTDIFYGATIGLGAVGILTKVTIQAGPKFNLEERATVLHWDAVQSDFERIMTESEYVKLLIDYHTGMVQIVSSNRTHAEPKNTMNLVVADMWTYVIEAFQFSTSFFPSAIPATMDFLIHRLGVFGNNTRIDEWHKVLSIQDRIPLHLESEFAVPFDKTPQAVATVFRIVKDIKVGISVLNEVRCSSGDKFWLSNSYAGTRCHVTLGLYNQDQRKEEYFGQVGERLLAVGAQPRPHWAKFYTLTETQLKSIYPKWSDFVTLKQKLDPNSMFCNGYLQRIFSESKVC